MSNLNIKQVSTVLLNKSLTTMIRGIRSQRDQAEERDYITKCLQEIRDELQTSYPDIKAQALQKLVYLQMLGYDIAWASFHMVEVMSSPWFGHKRIGYLAASLTFNKDTDVILLTTHLFRKGFSQPQSIGSASAEGLQFETGAAITCLANICTPDLAIDLLNDVVTLLNSSRPYIRKKAVLVLYRMYRQWPKALRLSFDRLKEKLNDEHPAVVSATVYVICELAAKNPKNYLSLAPQLFKILTTSSNNWILIKVVKLLGSLTPLEPRLAKKLLEPLTDIVSTTPAKSLLFECISTILSGELKSRSVIRLCLDKLRTFIEDPDQNLKYLGLLGLHKLMKKHPRVVAEHKDLILNCLRDDDVTIRMRALDLITSMVSQRNLEGIVKKLIEHLDQSDGSYREHVLERIIFICAQDHYAYIGDFEWYIATLVDLTHVSGASRQNAQRICQQLTDVAIRVPGVRRFAVKAMSDVLLAGRLLTQSLNNNTMAEVLHAAAFIVGEFAEYVEEHLELVRSLLRPEVLSLSVDSQTVFLQSVIKVFGSGLLQPYDNVAAATSDEADVDGAAKNARVIGRKRRVDDDEEEDDQGDEVEEYKAKEKKPVDEEDDEEEEDDGDENELDENGIKRRKNRAKKRSFKDWAMFIVGMLELLYVHLPAFTQSPFTEVQERAVTYLEFVAWFIQAAGLTSGISVPVVSNCKQVQLPSAAAVAAAAAAATPSDASGADASNADASADSSSAAATSASAAASPSSAASPRSAFDASSVNKTQMTSFAVQFNLLFAERLNPVNPKAQRKVPLPKGLDLDAMINPEAFEDSDASDDDDDASDDDDSDDGGRKKKGKKKGKKDSKRDKKDAKRDKKSKDADVEEYMRPLTAAEKEEARKRVDARRAAQMNDPFYIKERPAVAAATSSTSLLGGAGTGGSPNADDIPVRHLDSNDLPRVVVESTSGDGKKSKKSKKDKKGKKNDSDDDLFTGKAPTKQTKVFKVKQVEDMPEGASSSDDERAKKRTASDDEMDVDLTTPLGADDVVPKAKSYAERRAQEAAAKKGAKKDEKKSKKGKKDEKDKEKGKKSSKSKKGEDADDEDEDELSGEDDKDKKKSKKSKEKEKEKDKKRESVSAPSPAASTPTASSSSFSSANNKEKDVLAMFDPIARESAPSAAANEDGSEKTKNKKDKKDKEESRKSVSESSSSSTSASPDVQPAWRPLFSDSSLVVQYSAKLAKTSGSKHVVHVRVQAQLKPKKGKLINSLALNVTGSKKARLSAKPGGGKISRGGGDDDDDDDEEVLKLSGKDVAKDATFSDVFSVECSSAEKAVKLDVKLDYLIDKGKHKKGEECTLAIPLSTFVVAKSVSASEFASLVSDRAKTKESTVKTVELESGVVASNVIERLPSILNVAIVEVIGTSATLYGQTVGGIAVFLLLKAKKADDTKVSIEIKSSDRKLCDALLTDADEMLSGIEA